MILRCLLGQAAKTTGIVIDEVTLLHLIVESRYAANRCIGERYCKAMPSHARL